MFTKSKVLISCTSNKVELKYLNNVILFVMCNKVMDWSRETKIKYLVVWTTGAVFNTLCLIGQRVFWFFKLFDRYYALWYKCAAKSIYAMWKTQRKEPSENGRGYIPTGPSYEFVGGWNRGKTRGLVKCNLCRITPARGLLSVAEHVHCVELR